MEINIDLQKQKIYIVIDLFKGIYYKENLMYKIKKKFHLIFLTQKN